MEEKDIGVNSSNTEDMEINEDPIDSDDSESLVSKELIEKRGCLKGCLLPIIIFSLIILSLGMIIHAKRGFIYEWLIIRIVSNTQELAISNSPQDADKKQIETTFDKTKKAVKEDLINEQLMNQAIKEYIDKIKKKPSNDVKKAELEKLIKALNEAIYPSG